MNYSTIILFSSVLPNFGAVMSTVAVLSGLVLIGSLLLFYNEDLDERAVSISERLANSNDKILYHMKLLEEEINKLDCKEVEKHLKSLIASCEIVRDINENKKREVENIKKDKGSVKKVIVVSAILCIITGFFAIITPNEKNMERYIMMRFVEEHCLTGEMTDAIMNRFDELLTIIDNHYKK